MLPERASSIHNRPIPRQPSGGAAPSAPPSRLSPQVREAIDAVMVIEAEMTPEEMQRNPIPDPTLRESVLMAAGSRYLGTVIGRLKLDSEAAYAQLDAALTPHDTFAMLRAVNDRQVFHLFAGRISPPPRPIWVNVALFIATFFSVLLVGTEMAISEIAGTGASQREIEALVTNFFGEMWRGLPYAVSILLILGAHELGHYFAGRRHRLAVTLPYFIPMPFNNIGTFGAFIQLRQPMRNRKVLLDVGLSGPLMGLIFAIPIVVIGLATSPVKVIQTGIVEGNSFLYALAKTVVFGEFLPNGTYDVYVNQLAWAGWTGLLITGLNLIPVGQLDGGHVMYALLGERARQFFFPLMVAMGALVLFTVSISPVWVVWLVMLLFLGRVYAVPLDNITPLDPMRRRLALLGVLIFIVTFVPLPLAPIEGVTLPDGASAWAIPAVALVSTLWTRRDLIRLPFRKKPLHD